MTATLERNSTWQADRQEASNKLYHYRLQMEDACGNLSDFGPVISTLLAGGENQDNQRNTLYWNSLPQAEREGGKYEILRQAQNGNFNMIGTTNTSAYSDEDFFEAGAVQTCYQIRYGDSACTTLSPVFCLPYRATIHIPNAFSPNDDTLNTFWRPVTIGLTSFHIRVFNSWGQFIYEGDETSRGWDGTCKGGACEEGMYFYQFHSPAHAGEVLYRSGMIYLVR